MRQISEEVYELITRKGFIDSFWRHLRGFRNCDETITQRQVFEWLNNMYEAEFGEPKFPSFDAFRKDRDKSSI